VIEDFADPYVTVAGSAVRLLPGQHFLRSNIILDSIWNFSSGVQAFDGDGVLTA
jgi:hypothetical protein